MLPHRRSIARALRLVGPGLFLVGGVCAAGLGFHAANEWHHHGEVRAGFFHLHFHVGDHDHEEHDHGVPVDPPPGGSEERESQRSPTFTITQAVPDPPPLTPAVARPDLAQESITATGYAILRSQDLHDSARPRAPPV